jgi:hypothetical protein
MLICGVLIRPNSGLIFLKISYYLFAAVSPILRVNSFDFHLDDEFEFTLLSRLPGFLKKPCYLHMWHIQAYLVCEPIRTQHGHGVGILILLTAADGAL